ncbi:MAG: DNA-directed RNA polymerase subunit beta, partial [Anaerotignum sp.]|nr:DNA-directed RNA polymerase subunit beta [Anaerotignum sp.]
AGVEVRDVNASHYGRICPIESPEGQNIGLITSLASYAKVDEYGFIMTPYRKVVDRKLTDEVEYLTADEEAEFIISQATIETDDENKIVPDQVTARYKGENILAKSDNVDYVDVSPQQVVAVTTSCIPFLEHDDATRALMGANMQRQSVPLLKSEAPFIGTGVEYIAAKDSGAVVVSKADGVVDYVDAKKIVIKNVLGQDIYHLSNYELSNAGTCQHHRPIVRVGDTVKRGQVIADGPSTDKGELALGKNVVVAFMTYNGYNYEDAVILNENLVKDDVYTSLHMEDYQMQCRDTKLGPEEITRDIPNVSEEARKNLDENGIVMIGTEVKEGDILVGKVTPKGMAELTSEEKLLHAIFGEKTREVRDTSLRVPHGGDGIVHDVKIYSRKENDELPAGVSKVIRIYIIQKRKISVGDKMAGRHGNKGVVSRVLPVEDMPFLPNGRPLDIVLNPLGIPSRMNIGQVLETHLSLAAKALGWKISTPVFDGANEIDIMDTLEMANDYVNTSWEEFSAKWEPLLNGDILDELYANRDHREEWKGVALGRDGKVQLRDGRSGEPFDNRVTIGFMHYLKLHHLVDEKIHARSTGPYSLVTQQPLGGKAQFGGQRFGEMEVWALEAYGAAYTLQEILTVKSDDIVGRVKTYEAIVKGENIPEPGVPESFKVLLKELQSLALDIRVLREDQTEVEIKECIEDVDDLNVNIDGYEDDDYRRPRPMTAEEELVDFLFDDETGVEADNSDLLSDDYAGEDDGFDYEDEV